MQGQVQFSIPMVPPSVNHAYRHAVRGGRAVTYRAPEADAFALVAASSLPKLDVPMDGRLELRVTFGISDARKLARSDVDNLLKLLCDALQRSGVVRNDSRLVRIVAEKEAAAADATAGTVSALG